MKKLLVSLSLALTLVGTASPAMAATGPQRFIVVFRGTTGPVFATGVINGSGQVSNVVPEVLDPEAGTFSETDRLTFPEGTIDVLFKGTVSGFFPDPNTCVARPSGSGTWTVVGGSGAYEDASGGGTFTFPAVLVFPRTANGCGEEPILTLAFVTAEGTISV